jgi:hypothetical protein
MSTISRGDILTLTKPHVPRRVSVIREEAETCAGIHADPYRPAT